MRKNPLVVKLVQPGGSLKLKRLGGPGSISQNVLDRVVARFLARFEMVVVISSSDKKFYFDSVTRTILGSTTGLSL